MQDGARSARSAALLLGFWLAAWLQVAAALVAVMLILALLPGSVALRVGAPFCIATAGLLGFATTRALRVRQATPAGVPVTRADAPELWSLIDAAAAAARVAPPDAVTVTADARAWLSERFRLIGLLGGRRELYLGLPLLQAWDVARLRAVVAHELAHGSPELGRFAPMAYRGRLALGRIVPRIPRRSPAGPLLRAYAGWFRRLDAPFGRAQELAADRIAAEFAGASAVAAVLRDGPAFAGMQRLFHAEYVSPGWQAGYVPDDVFGGFLRVLAARADEVAALRALPPEPPGGWDAHPPLADRMAALADHTAAESPTAGAPSAVPGVSSAVPGGSSAVPGAPSAVPGASLGVPGGSSAVPGGSSAVPGGSSAVPGVSSGTPGVSAAPGEQFPAPGAAFAAPGEQPSPAAIGASTGGAGADLGAGPAAGVTSDARFAPGVGVAPGAGVGTAPDAATDEPGSASDAAAGELLPDLPGLGRALQAVAYPATGRTVLSWDEFFGVARDTEMEREVDAALRAIGRAAGAPVTSPAEVLDLVADGRLHRAAEVLFGDLPPAETSDRIAELVTLLLALAALRSRVARWRHSWTGTAELVAIDGSYLDLGEPVALASDPATVDEARKRLIDLGIDLASVGDDAADRGPARVPVLGGVVNVLVDGARTDLLVVDTGLLLVPSLPRARNGDAKRRLGRLAGAGVRADGSSAADVPGEPGGRFVSFADVADASVTQGRRRQWSVALAAGTTLTIRAALDSDELPGGWTALDDAVAFLAHTRTSPPSTPPSSPEPESVPVASTPAPASAPTSGVP